MVVLIGDIISSKELSTREEVQERLQSVLDRINREGRDILSPHTITLGDEFQAVYSSVSHIFDHIWLILYELHPVKVRFSIGVGEITTDINREQAIGMDGPAFYYAREGIEMLKEEKKLFTIHGKTGICSKLIKQSLSLISDLMKNWEKKRFAVLYGLSRARTINEIANFLDISERSVYKNIQAGSLETILETTGEIASLINIQKSGSE